jgi:hypothetical protein
MMRAVLEIIRKDLESNARPVSLLLVAVAALAFVIAAIKPGGMAPTDQVVFISNLNLVSVVALAQWVVGTEKQRKTIIILKMLPMDAGGVVFSKIASAFFMQEAVFLSSVIAVALAVHRFPGVPAVGMYLVLVLLNLTELTFLALMLACMFRFEPKTAVVAPLICLLILVLAWTELDQTPSGKLFFKNLSSDVPWKIVLPPILLGIIFLTWLYASRCFDKKEPNQLVSEV